MNEILHLTSSTTRKSLQRTVKTPLKNIKKFKQTKISNKFIHASFIRKDANNSSNYRESLLSVCTKLIKNQSNYFAN